MMNSQMNLRPSEMPLLVRIVAMTCAITIAALLVSYVTHFGKPDFSSDDAVLSMQAESMWEQGTLFPKGWIYNNGDTLMPSGTLIVAPLLAWFPNNYELHAVVGIFAIALLFFSVIRFLIAVAVPRPLIWVAVAVVASGLSRASAIMLYLQTTYVWWPAGFFLGAATILHHRRANGFAKPIVGCNWIAIATIVFLMGFANPSRALLMLVIPLYAFDRALVNAQNLPPLDLGARIRSFSGATDKFVLFGIVAPFGFAAFLYVMLLRVGVLQSMDNASNLRWDGWAGVVAHSRIFVDGWIGYLGGISEPNLWWARSEVILQPARVAFVVWLSWVGVAEVSRISRNDEPARSALTIALIAAFSPVFFMYLIFSPLAQDYSTTRYFTLVICILIVLATIRLARSTGWRRMVLNWACLPLCILLLMVSAVRFVPAFSRPGGSLLATGTSMQMRLAKMLADEGLHWGYATWWNAGATTVLSGGGSRVNPIVLDNGRLSPYPVMRQSKWYSPSAWNGETFLALSHGEASIPHLETIEAVLGKPSRMVNGTEYLILVYGNNIGSAIGCDRGDQMNRKIESGPAPAHIVSVLPINTGEGRLEPRQLKVVVRNDGSDRISGHGRFPIAIGIRTGESEAGSESRELVHWALPCAIDPAGERSIVVDLPSLPVHTRSIELNVLQEGVVWFDQLGADWFVLPVGGPPSDEILRENFDSSSSM